MTGRSEVLAVRGLNASYGQAQVLFGIDLTVLHGEVVVLLGRNGAGKSSTLKSIIGLMAPAEGEILFGGRPIAGLPSYVICRLGLGYVPEDRRIFTDLSVMENLEVARQPPRSGVSWTPERLFELFPNLREMRSRRGGQMSGGEQQMLSIARTLMGNPSIVLLDEPSEGLAPAIIDQLAATILSLKAQGLAILLSEQNLRFAMRVSDRAYFIEKGHIRYNGAMQEISGNAQICATYLAV